MGIWRQWHIVQIGAEVTDIVLSLVREVIALVRFVILFTNFDTCIETDGYFASLVLVETHGRRTVRSWIDGTSES
jgi:hypothetical protein